MPPVMLPFRLAPFARLRLVLLWAASLRLRFRLRAGRAAPPAEGLLSESFDSSCCFLLIAVSSLPRRHQSFRSCLYPQSQFLTNSICSVPDLCLASSRFFQRAFCQRYSQASTCMDNCFAIAILASANTSFKPSASPMPGR